MWKNDVPFKEPTASRTPHARKRAASTSKAVKLGAVGLLAAAAAGSVWGVGSMVNATPVFEVQTAQAQAASSADESQDNVKKQVVVYVSGAVACPGVYTLDEGSRVNDAIALAGGLAQDAECSTVNLARVVSDGEQIPIPTQAEVQEAAAAAASGASASSGAAAGVAASGLVNINTADETALQTLSGVGPSTAAAIVAERQKNGAFATVEDIMRVDGIGEKKFAKIKDSICV